MIYCYHCKNCGRKFEKHKPMQHALRNERCPHCRSRNTVRDLRAEHLPRPGKVERWRNFYSEALAVHPKQIPEARDFLKARGVQDTQFDSWGRPKLVSRKHRKDVCRAFGVHDLDGGYGDA